MTISIDSNWFSWISANFKQICYNKTMPKVQFFVLVCYTLIQSQLLVWSLNSGSIFFVAILAIMLASNIFRAYQIEKIARQNGLI